MSMSEDNITFLKPVTKWVGGKRQLLPKLYEYMPPYFNTYYEPFVGGGAMLFSVAPKIAVINDINTDLINTYMVIKDMPAELIDKLEEYQKKNSKEYYLKVRELDRSKNFGQLSQLDRAARFLYMLRVDFNGLYRVNSKGQFNVPYGRYKNPKIVNKDNIIAVSEYFNCNKIEFCNEDFQIAVKKVQKQDFVYLDPPYIPLTATSDFTSYTADGFDLDDQKRLRNTFFELAERGAFVMLSNSDTELTRELYKGAKIHEVEAKRAINANAAKRGKVGELIITSY